VSNYLFICAGNSVNCYQPSTGALVASYRSDEKLSAMHVVGNPVFTDHNPPPTDPCSSDAVDMDSFVVITGSYEGTLNVYNGKVCGNIKNFIWRFSKFYDLYMNQIFFI